MWTSAKAPSLAEMETMAHDIFERLPKGFRDLCEGVIIRVDDFPTERCSTRWRPRANSTCSACSRASACRSAAMSDIARLPNMVWLYRRPILDYWAEHDETLGHIVRHVLIHEIGHHFGLSDARHGGDRGRRGLALRNLPFNGGRIRDKTRAVADLHFSVAIRNHDRRCRSSMEKFTTLEGVAAPLKIINVDTDMIIPKQYLKTIKRTGLGKGLFSEQRYKDDGSENPDFILNKPAYRNAKVLVAGDNFGCGSSREHAPWALLDFGIRCVISTSFGDIFYNNCFKNGILPIRVTQEDLDKLFDDAERGANATLTIDLRQAGNPRSRRRHGEVRDRSVPQALPAERPRRHRPDDGEEGLDRQLRGQGQDRARLGLIFPDRHLKPPNGLTDAACGLTSSPSGMARSMRSG